MKFYPEHKDGMSPSSIASWIDSRSSFIKTYFKGEKIHETKYMRTGTQVHRLIEAGLIKVDHNYTYAEDEISVTIEQGMIFRGRPDSWGKHTEGVDFVDYKTGKENNWKDKLPSDIKMRATAFLVWSKGGKPDTVNGFIEFIQTEEKDGNVIPVEDKETEIESITYTGKEMEEFGRIILKEMQKVNIFYKKWKNSENVEFVQDRQVEEFIVLHRQIKELEAKLAPIKQDILDQMEFGGKENHNTPYGTFYLTHKKKYDYPDELVFRVDEREFSFEEAQDIAIGLKSSKKNYELANEPVSTTTAIGFRAKK